ncbi:MAG: outer membrane beta-barrel protein [Bacteroidota bacterium]
MKSTIHLLLLLLLGGLPALLPAQLTIRSTLGVSMVSQSIDWGYEDPEDFGFAVRPRRSLELGGSLSYRLPGLEMLELQLGALLHNRGSSLVQRRAFREAGEMIKVQTRLTYVEVPMGIRLQPLPQFPMTLESGFAFALGFDGSMKSTVTISGERHTEDLGNPFSLGEYGRLDVRLYVGGAIRLPKQSGEIGGRINLGAANIFLLPRHRAHNHAITLFFHWPLEMKI